VHGGAKKKWLASRFFSPLPAGVKLASGRKASPKLLWRCGAEEEEEEEEEERQEAPQTAPPGFRGAARTRGG